MPVASKGIFISALYYILYPVMSLMGIFPLMSPDAVHARRVPSLGGYTAETRGDVILLIGCISGMIFGGIHCIGWNQGQIQWRVFSLAMLGAPVSIFLCYSYSSLRKYWRRMPSIDSFFQISLVISFMVYFIARIALIVLVVMNLLSPPLGVYNTVTWTKFIPHYSLS